MTTVALKNFNPDYDESATFEITKAGECVLRVRFEFNAVSNKITTVPVLPHIVPVTEQARIIAKCADILDGYFATGTAVTSIAETM